MLNFASIISAVKPRDRTDQYKILAALFCLDAHVRPVTTKQVNDLLHLQLGKANVPSNLSSRFRKYSAYLDPAEQGPPLLWSLTQRGVERLRSLSGLELASVTTSSDYDTDVGFVCALEHPELAALLRAAGGKWSEVGDARFPHVYRATKIETAGGKSLRIVATTSTSMGLTAAAIATTHLILQFRPRLVVMVGIAAGTRGGDKQFGDVLVADPSVDYNSGKVEEKQGIRQFLPDPYPIGLNPRLRSLLQQFRSSGHTVFGEIRKKWKGDLPQKANRLHLGPLGAADQVIDDAMKIIEIQRNWRKLIGVEMETYGVYRACYEAPDPKPRFVSFKSVCDFAAEKTDSWQEYAAFTAAEFSIEFLKTEWDSLWPVS